MSETYAPETENTEARPDEPQEPVEAEVVEEAPEEGAQEQAETEEAPETPELTEVTFEGQTYQVPEGLKAAFEPKQPEPEPEPQQSQEDIQADLQDRGMRSHLTDQIQQYENVDWRAWEEQDLFAAQAGWRDYQMAKDRLATVEARIGQRERDKTQAAQEAFAGRVRKAQEVLKRDIKGWGPELAGKITEFAKAQGMSDQQIWNLNGDAAAVKLIHTAYIGSQLIEKQQRDAQKAKEAKPLDKPVSGRGQPAQRGLSDDLPIDEWMKRHAKMRDN